MWLGRLWNATLIGMGLCAALAHAEVLDLYVHERLDVHQKPKASAKKISELNRGDVVVISPKIYGEWRKVLVTYEGRRVGGYVRRSALIKSDIVERTTERRAYRDSTGIGLAFVWSYLQQGARSFTVTDGTKYEVSELVSNTYFFTLFADLAVSKDIGLRPYLSLRRVVYAGEAKLSGATAPGSSPDLELKQSLVGVGAVGKWYPWFAQSIWFGGGVELAKGTSVSLSLDGSALQTTDDNLPFYTMTFAAAGFDVAVVRPYFFVPEIRVGVIPNQDPFIYFAEITLNAAYAF